MKKVFLAVAAALMLVACGGGASSNSPVDQLLDLIEKNKEYLFDQDAPGAAEVAEQAEAIFEANKDYVLTDADKKKLGKTMGELIDAAFKAAEKSGQITEEQATLAKGFLDLAKDEMQKKIDKVEKLGDLKDLSNFNMFD